MDDPIDLRQLRAFLTAAEAGSISGAARKLFVTQPALSRQIQGLEEDLGVALLVREAHSIRLTAAGAVLVREAGEVLGRVRQMVERVRECGEGYRLRVGYAPSLAAGALSMAVASFTRRHAEARVELLDLSTQEMLAGLAEGTVDVAIAAIPAGGRDGLEWVPMRTAGWRVALNSSHALAGEEGAVRVEALGGEALLVFQRREYPEYWERVGGWLRRHRIRARVLGEHDGITSLLAAVESGMGVALVTACSERMLPDRVVLRRLSSEPEALAIGAGYRRERGNERLLVEFVEGLRSGAEGGDGMEGSGSPSEKKERHQERGGTRGGGSRATGKRKGQE